MEKKNERDKEHVRTATLACTVLNNVCLMRRDSFPRELDLKVDPDGNEKRNKDEIRKLLLMREFRRVHDFSGEATRVRDALCGKSWVENETGRVS